MKNILALLLIAAAVSSCKRDEPEPEPIPDPDFYCRVNGAEWAVNPSLTRDDEVAAVFQTDSGISIDVKASGDKTDVMEVFTIDIDKYHGTGEYDRADFEFRARKFKQAGIAMVPTDYLIDPSSPASLNITAYEPGARIAGTFSGKLYKAGAPGEDDQDITDGIFDCRIK